MKCQHTLIGLPLFILLFIYGVVGTLIFSAVFTVQVISAVLAPIAGAIYAWRSKGFGISMSRRIKIGAACFACLVLPWLFLMRSGRNEAPPSPSTELPPRWVRITWFAFVLSGPAPMIAGSFMNTRGATPLWLLVCTPLAVSAIIWIVLEPASVSGTKRWSGDKDGRCRDSTASGQFTGTSIRVLLSNNRGDSCVLDAPGSGL